MTAEQRLPSTPDNAGAHSEHLPPQILERFARTLGRGHRLWMRLGCEYPGAIWPRVALAWGFVVMPAVFAGVALGMAVSPVSALATSAIGVFGGIWVLRAGVYWLALRPTMTALDRLSWRQRRALVRQGQRRVEAAVSRMPTVNPPARKRWLQRDLVNRMRHGACGLFDDCPQRQLDALVYLRAPASSNTRTLAYDIEQAIERAWRVPEPAQEDTRSQSLRRLDQALAGT